MLSRSEDPSLYADEDAPDAISYRVALGHRRLRTQWTQPGKSADGRVLAGTLWSPGERVWIELPDGELLVWASAEARSFDELAPDGRAAATQTMLDLLLDELPADVASALANTDPLWSVAEARASTRVFVPAVFGEGLCEEWDEPSAALDAEPVLVPLAPERALAFARERMQSATVGERQRLVEPAALAAAQTVMLEYRAGNEGRPSQRVVTVLATSERMIEAYCHLRDDTRNFRLDRIEAWTPVDAAEYPLPEHYAPTSPRARARHAAVTHAGAHHHAVPHVRPLDDPSSAVRPFAAIHRADDFPF